MHFEIEEGVTDYKTIKVSCSDTYGNVCKEELTIFTNNSPSGTLIQLLKETLAIKERFEWFVEGGVNNYDADKKKKLIFQHLGGALKGFPKHKLAKIIKNHHTYTLNSFRDKAEQFFLEILGEEAYEGQYQLLCETEKPRNIKLADWIDRLEVINKRLVLINRKRIS